MPILKNINERIYNFSIHFITILSLILIGTLLICNFLHTCYATNMETQLVLFTWDSPLSNTIGLTAFLLLFYLIWHFSFKKSFFTPNFLFSITSMWILIIGVVLILFSKTVPAADAWSVYDIARKLAIGDNSVIHPTQSYLSYYPQQVGLVAFYEIWIRLWNLLHINFPAYHFLKILYVFFAIITLYFQSKTIHFLFKDHHLDCIFIVLMGANLPYIMYTSFVYGEIPSYMMLSIGIYYYFKMLHDLSTSESKLSLKFRCPHLRYGILSLICFTLSVQCRKNSLVFIIAILIVSFFQWIRTRKNFLLFFAVFCGIFSISILPLIEKSYELRSGREILTGVTPLSYFAMGMQESSRGDGWYNGFNFNTYHDSGMNTALTNQISRDAINERFTFFQEHPTDALHFYTNKFLTQWTDGTYASRQATLATFGGRKEFFNQLYCGTYSTYYISYCNFYLNIIYFGTFLFCLGMPLKKLEPLLPGLPIYLGIISIFGGFLFHMFWEANSRYILLYGQMLLPYAAIGLNLLFIKISSWFKHRTK